MGEGQFLELNIGLLWMVFATLFPLGIMQLYTAVNEGYFQARSLTFVTAQATSLIEWLRLPGDVVFIVGGVGTFLYLTILAIKYRHFKGTALETETTLFTNTTEPGETGQGKGESDDN